MNTRHAERLSEALFLPLRLARQLVPERLRRALEDRLFYAIFQVTRVTNDAYPTRPPPGGPAPAAPEPSAPAAGLREPGASTPPRS